MFQLLTRQTGKGTAQQFKSYFFLKYDASLLHFIFREEFILNSATGRPLTTIITDGTAWPLGPALRGGALISQNPLRQLPPCWQWQQPPRWATSQTLIRQQQQYPPNRPALTLFLFHQFHFHGLVQLASNLPRQPCNGKRRQTWSIGRDAPKAPQWTMGEFAMACSNPATFHLWHNNKAEARTIFFP